MRFLKLRLFRTFAISNKISGPLRVQNKGRLLYLLFYQPLSSLIQTEISLINIDYDLNPLIHNVKKWPNLTIGLFLPRQIFYLNDTDCLTISDKYELKG